ncbi:hypothetical protein Emag_001946 [Eimeria magna]
MVSLLRLSRSLRVLCAAEDGPCFRRWAVGTLFFSPPSSERAAPSRMQQSVESGRATGGAVRLTDGSSELSPGFFRREFFRFSMGACVASALALASTVLFDGVLGTDTPARCEGPAECDKHSNPLWRSRESQPFTRKLGDALLFTGTANEQLGAAVADRLSTHLGRVSVGRFADGEADVARMMEAMGVDRVVAVDLHCGQIQGFFGPRVPVDNVEAQIVGLDYFETKQLNNPVVVSPDAGGVYRFMDDEWLCRARKFQEGMVQRGYSDCSIAMLIKRRIRANEVESMDLVGSVDGRDAIIVDDMIDTAGTLVEAARELKSKGAKRVFAFATHGLFSGPAIDRIQRSALEEVVITDTIKSTPDECPS